MKSKTEATSLPNYMNATFQRFRNSLALILAAYLLATQIAWANDYQIGVFYFPGWKDGQVGAPSAQPWNPIKQYPDREPLLGWYDEGSDDVMRQHLDWIHAASLDFVVFDWYYVNGRKVVLEHALAAFMRAKNRGSTKFSILWANHSDMPKSMLDWKAMVSYWVKYYFPREDFLRIDGKPVVFVFSADELRKQAEKFGVTSKELIDGAQEIARDAGFPGIYLVAGTGAYLSMIDTFAKDAGYSAFSAYNYHQGPVEPLKRPSQSYAELDRGYRAHWQRFAEFGKLPLIVPMTSGWDKRPWGGSTDPLHDNSMGTPVEFEKHLMAARSYMDSNRKITSGVGVICCWNEFGEGSFIEPTKKFGFEYLDRVKKVFGKP
jgi:hypothetical protein